MRGYLLEIPESLLAERRRLGIDTRDEMWKGVLHMPPPPSDWHQRLGFRLGVALAPVADALGFEASHETGLYQAEKNYVVPDMVITLPSQRSQRGVEGSGAELVVEILSPDDETYDKLDFYAAFPVREVLVIAPESRAVELFVLRGGKYHAALPDENGRLRSVVLGVTFATRAGPKLEVVTPQGTTSI